MALGEPEQRVQSIVTVRSLRIMTASAIQRTEGTGS